MKQKKGNLKKISFAMNTLNFGTIGIKSLNSGTLKYSQKLIIENFILKKTKNKIKFWFNLSSFKSITKKGIGVRMGKGCGKILTKISKIKAGQILIEFCNTNNKLTKHILKKTIAKLPIKSKIIINQIYKKLYNLMVECQIFNL